MKGMCLCFALTACSFSCATQVKLGVDASNRILSVEADNYNALFTYDSVNNISSEVSNNTVKRYSYADHCELIAINDDKFVYDELGRLTNDGKVDISYDEFNMMKTFGSSRYFYDHSTGLRKQKIVDGKVIKFELDEYGRVIKELSSDGRLISRIVWEGDLPKSYYYNGNVYNYKCNGHGDVIALTNTQGDVVNSYSYDVFGGLLEVSEAVPNPIRYAHEYYDNESGLYYLRGRYYSPFMRRFTTPDPAEDGINHYAYCGNNPLFYIDPFGYAYFKNTLQHMDNIILTKYFSGKDLRDLYDSCNLEAGQHTTATEWTETKIWDKLRARYNVANSVSYAIELVCMDEDNTVKTILSWVWAGLRRTYESVNLAGYAFDFADFVEGSVIESIRNNAKKALDANKGLAIQWDISPDDALALPNFKLVNARDVEAYAAGTKRPVGWI